MSEVQIHGSVAPGFESVRALFEHKMNRLKERHSQLCVYVKGEQVVDLWASAVDEPGFSPDSLVNVFSSGKSLEAIAMGALAGKGLVDFTAKVADYWPEFAQAGKADLTVAELMRHEAGLAGFNTSIEPTDLYRDKIKANKIGELIETHPQTYPAASRREYHAITRGWIINEVFRRIDPEGRTIGEFLEAEVNAQLGTESLMGLSEEAYTRRVPVVPLSFKFQFFESLKFKSRRKMEHNIFQIIVKFLRLLPMLRNGTGKGNPPPYVGMDSIGFFNEKEVAMGETPSAATSSSARSLAKIAAAMATRGTLDGKQIMTEAGWSAMHDDPDTKAMNIGETTFTQGGVNMFATDANSSKAARDFNGGREGFYGWMGLGGSIFQWHPAKEIGFGYVPTSLNVLDLYNERGKDYQSEVLKCVSRLG